MKKVLSALISAAVLISAIPNVSAEVDSTNANQYFLNTGTIITDSSGNTLIKNENISNLHYMTRMGSYNTARTSTYMQQKTSAVDKLKTEGDNVLNFNATADARWIPRWDAPLYRTIAKDIAGDQFKYATYEFDVLFGNANSAVSLSFVDQSATAVSHHVNIKASDSASNMTGSTGTGDITYSDIGVNEWHKVRVVAPIDSTSGNICLYVDDLTIPAARSAAVVLNGLKFSDTIGMAMPAAEGVTTDVYLDNIKLYLGAEPSKTAYAAKATVTSADASVVTATMNNVVSVYVKNEGDTVSAEAIKAALTANGGEILGIYDSSLTEVTENASAGNKVVLINSDNSLYSYYDIEYTTTPAEEKKFEYNGETVYFECSTSKNPLEYAVNEQMTFKLRPKTDAGYIYPPYIGYTCWPDYGTNTSGYIEADSEGYYNFTASCTGAGFVRLRAWICDEDKNILAGDTNMWNDTDVSLFNGSAGADIYNIKCNTTEPEDYDIFWNGVNETATSLDNTEIYRSENISANENYEAYEVHLATAEGAGDYASFIYTYPKNAENGSLKFKMKFQGYGASAVVPCYESDTLCVSMQTHDVSNMLTKDEYEALIAEGGKYFRYGRVPENNMKPESSDWWKIFVRDTQVFKYMLSNELLSGDEVVVTGHSQGGFRAMNIAAHNAEVTLCDVSAPWMADIFGEETGRKDSCFSPDEKDGDGVTAAGLAYFDSAVAAKHIECPVNITAGLGDYTCPPSTIMAIYNNLNCKKTLTFVQNRVHNSSLSNLTSYTISAEAGSLESITPVLDSDSRIYVTDPVVFSTNYIKSADDLTVSVAKIAKGGTETALAENSYKTTFTGGNLTILPAKEWDYNTYYKFTVNNVTAYYITNHVLESKAEKIITNESFENSSLSIGELSQDVTSSGSANPDGKSAYRLNDKALGVELNKYDTTDGVVKYELVSGTNSYGVGGKILKVTAAAGTKPQIFMGGDTDTTVTGGKYVMSFSIKFPAAYANWSGLIDVGTTRQWNAAPVFSNFGISGVSKAGTWATIPSENKGSNISRDEWHDYTIGVDFTDAQNPKYMFVYEDGILLGRNINAIWTPPANSEFNRFKLYVNNTAATEGYFYLDNFNVYVPDDTSAKAVVITDEEMTVGADSITVSAKATTADEAADINVIIALYDVNGVLVKAQIDKKTISDFTTNGEISSVYTLSDLDAEMPENPVIKAFIWDGVTLLPFTDVIYPTV